MTQHNGMRMIFCLWPYNSASTKCGKLHKPSFHRLHWLSSCPLFLHGPVAWALATPNVLVPNPPPTLNPPPPPQPFWLQAASKPKAWLFLRSDSSSSLCCVMISPFERPPPNWQIILDLVKGPISFDLARRLEPREVFFFIFFLKVLARRFPFPK
jgi:hypothetical protein